MTPLIQVEDVRQWFAQATDEEIYDLLSDGLMDLLEDLEDDDYFGTEGFNKRFS